MLKLHLQSEAFIRNREKTFKSPALIQKHCSKADSMLWARPTSLDNTLPLDNATKPQQVYPHRRACKPGAL